MNENVLRKYWLEISVVLFITFWIGSLMGSVGTVTQISPHKSIDCPLQMPEVCKPIEGR